MRKIFIFLVGLALSLGAVTLQEINYNGINLGSIKFDQDAPGRRVDQSHILSKVNGKLFLDYVTFDRNGKLKDISGNVAYIKQSTTKREEASAIVTVRPVAINPLTKKGFWGIPGFPDDNWSPMYDQLSIGQQKGSGNGTSAAILTGGLNSAGFSNSASAGAGAALMLLGNDSPRVSVIFYVKVNYMDKHEEETFVYCEDIRTDYANFPIEDILNDLNQQNSLKNFFKF